MHYYVKDHTLVIKGDFDGLSTGINGGRRQVRSVINHEVGKDFNNDEPLKLLDEVAAAVGADTPYFGFLTAVKMRNLCVVRDAYTHGVHHRRHQQPVPRPGRARDDQRPAGHPRQALGRRARRGDHHGHGGEGQGALRDGVRLHRHDDRRGRGAGRSTAHGRLWRPRSTSTRARRRRWATASTAA